MLPRLYDLYSFGISYLTSKPVLLHSIYSFYDTQVLHPIAIAQAINVGLFLHQNPSYHKIQHFTAFSVYIYCRLLIDQPCFNPA